jgi:hypothetical protein
MPTLPAELLPLIVEFAPLFSKSVWGRAKTLLIGAILAVGNRTVTACLRVKGNSQDKRFQNYHRVLNRDRWSALQASQVLLRMLVAAFAPSGELIIGIDDTIERRCGEKIKANCRRKLTIKEPRNSFCGRPTSPTMKPRQQLFLLKSKIGTARHCCEDL